MNGFNQATLDDEIRYRTGKELCFTLEQLYEHYERITNDKKRLVIDGTGFIYP